jgi:Ca2+:H+ antiporter
LIETVLGSLGSTVKIILYVVFIFNHNTFTANGRSEEGNLIPVVQAATPRFVLTTLLLYLGPCCFFDDININVVKLVLPLEFQGANPQQARISR